MSVSHPVERKPSRECIVRRCYQKLPYSKSGLARQQILGLDPLPFEIALRCRPIAGPAMTQREIHGCREFRLPNSNRHRYLRRSTGGRQVELGGVGAGWQRPM